MVGLDDGETVVGAWVGKVVVGKIVGELVGLLVDACLF